jgi:hypothetical protein
MFNGYIHYIWGIFNSELLVNIQKTIENHHFEWVNQLYMIIFNSYFDITRGYHFGAEAVLHDISASIHPLGTRKPAGHL